MFTASDIEGLFLTTESELHVLGYIVTHFEQSHPSFVMNVPKINTSQMHRNRIEEECGLLRNIKITWEIHMYHIPRNFEFSTSFYFRGSLGLNSNLSVICIGLEPL